MTQPFLLHKVPEHERLELLGRTLPRACGDAVSWATEADGERTVYLPEPSCAHGGWAPELEGRPEQLATSGSHHGVYLWRSMAGWHLAISAPPGTIATGSFMTDGILAGVSHHALHSSAVRTDPMDGGLRFRVAVGDGHAGFDFRVGCGSALTFTGFVGTRRLTPAEVFLGAHGQHPDELPFRLERQAPTYRPMPSTGDVTIQL